MAGVPEQVVAQAKEVMARWEAGGQSTQAVREAVEELQVPGDDQTKAEVIDELCNLDIAHLTPVQALVALNEWQGRLRPTNEGPAPPRNQAPSLRA